MDWKICAAEDLRRYNTMKIGILNARDKLRLLDVSKKRIASSVQKGKSLDARIVDSLVEAERLETSIKLSENLCALIERGLSALTDKERKILEDFYMRGTPKSALQLTYELGGSTRSIYRVRDNALEKFTLAMYGVGVL